MPVVGVSLQKPRDKSSPFYFTGNIRIMEKYMDNEVETGLM